MEQIEQQTVKVDTTKSGWRTKLSKPSPVAFEPGKSFWIHMETTKGTIVIKLLPDVAPMHVTSFLYLTQLGYFDGLAFHRVIQGFMAQGGCPLGTGTGGPGYQFAGECKPNVKHDRPGLLSMANAGPGTDGSQFFLTFMPTPWLDGKHTIFGEITEGMEALEQIEVAGSKDGRPKEPLQMNKVTFTVR